MNGKDFMHGERGTVKALQELTEEQAQEGISGKQEQMEGEGSTAARKPGASQETGKWRVQPEKGVHSGEETGGSSRQGGR